MSDRQQSVVEDLNSTNGVFIKSKRVKRQELVDGDVIQLGEHKLLYRDTRQALGHAEDYEEEDALDDEDADDADEDEDEDEDEFEEQDLERRD